MSDSNRYSGAHLLIAFVAGAVAGAVTALLAAPQSGRETREQVRGWARDLGEKAEGSYARAADAAKSAFSRALRKDEPEAGDT